MGAFPSFHRLPRGVKRPSAALRLGVCAGGLFALCCALGAEATTITNTRIIAVRVTGAGFVTLTTALTPTGRPVCGTAGSDPDEYYAFDVTTNAGKILLAQALIAYALQSKVDVSGSGCYTTGVTLINGFEAATSIRLIP
jgi:hypothetical protein